MTVIPVYLECEVGEIAEVRFLVRDAANVIVENPSCEAVVQSPDGTVAFASVNEYGDRQGFSFACTVAGTYTFAVRATDPVQTVAQGVVRVEATVFGQVPA